MSGCTEASVPVPSGTHILTVQEGTFAILECDSGYMFPTTSDGAIWCQGGVWTGDIPACIRYDIVVRTTEGPINEETTSVVKTTSVSPSTTPEQTTLTTTKQPTTTATSTTATSTAASTTKAVTTSTSVPSTATTVEVATTAEPSRCTRDLVQIPDGTKLLVFEEGKFAVLECKTGYEFPTDSDGAYFCVDNKWSGNIPACIPRKTTPSPPTTSASPRTTSTTGATTTGSSSTTTAQTTTGGDGFTVCQNCPPPTTEIPGSGGMNDMSVSLLGVGLGLIFVLFIVGMTCFIHRVVSKRKRRKDEEELENYINKRTENNNTGGKPLNHGGKMLVDGDTTVWVSSGSIYGGGTYVPIPPKSENTYLSAEPLSDKTATTNKSKRRGTKNSNNKEIDDDVHDTSRLILRYSGSSIDSEPTITPPSTISSSYLMRSSQEADSTAGYNRRSPSRSFPGSDVSLTSLYGVDAGVYDSILSDLEPQYVPHAVADAPAKRRPSIGHCI